MLSNELNKIQLILQGNLHTTPTGVWLKDFHYFTYFKCNLHGESMFNFIQTCEFGYFAKVNLFFQFDVHEMK